MGVKIVLFICENNVKWFVLMVFLRIRVNKKRKNTIHIFDEQKYTSEKSRKQ